MKIACSLILSLFICYANGKERVYIGSTPANNVVKSFLQIPFSDSVDFIRWKLTMQDEKFKLLCNYGIGKPNTKGFINGGKWIEHNGPLKKDGNYYILRAANRELFVFELSSNLIHLADQNKNLLVGTGGWSYTLNINKLLTEDNLNLKSKQNVLEDSMAFQGRTPCKDFSINRPGPECIKMKWLIVFYADTRRNVPTTYLLNRSDRLFLQYPGKKGTWKIIRGKDGRIIYELKPENDDIPTYLLKLDDNVLVFTDGKGNLLVGDENFSFTLSRK
jgi:hypothetical protein